MSLNIKAELHQIAISICRELRKSSTPAERILWDRLRNRKCNNLKFYRQHPIFYDVMGKESFFISDFYCSEKKLVIELDGETHKFSIKEDSERTRILNCLGIEVIRFTNDAVFNNIDDVLSEIAQK